MGSRNLSVIWGASAPIGCATSNHLTRFIVRGVFRGPPCCLDLGEVADARVANNHDVSFLRAPQVSSVFLVLFAGIRHDFRILARDGQRDGPRFRIKLWIFESDSPLDIVTGGLLEFFDEMQLVAVLMASRVEPGPVVEPDGVHEQRVSFPLADGIPKPRGVHIPGMTASVRVNDAKRVLILEKDGRHSWGLNDLEWHDSRLNPSGRTDR